MGDPRTLILEQSVDFSHVLRFEARIFASGLAGVRDVEAYAVTKCGVFKANIPCMVFFFHFVALVLDAEFFVFAFLRFEAIFGFALFGSELAEVVQTFVEGAGVRGLVAEVEGEQRGVCDLAGLRVETGVLEGLCAVGEPVGFGHPVD